MLWCVVRCGDVRRRGEMQPHEPRAMFVSILSISLGLQVAAEAKWPRQA